MILLGLQSIRAISEYETVHSVAEDSPFPFAYILGILPVHAFVEQLING